jgi:hypothetical protein
MLTMLEDHRGLYTQELLFLPSISIQASSVQLTDECVLFHRVASLTVTSHDTPTPKLYAVEYTRRPPRQSHYHG